MYMADASERPCRFAGSTLDSLIMAVPAQSSTRRSLRDDLERYEYGYDRGVVEDIPRLGGPPVA